MGPAGVTVKAPAARLPCGKTVIGALAATALVYTLGSRVLRVGATQEA